jgi:hypothetical protein
VEMIPSRFLEEMGIRVGENEYGEVYEKLGEWDENSGDEMALVEMLRMAGQKVRMDEDG